MRALALQSLALIALLAPTPGALARDARCEIAENGRVVFNRICDFMPDGRDGSFSLSARNRQGALYGE
ncbi:MAG: hypothetical protein FJX29_08915, partial [Alphaproteobacteria bacterium]|nr:hypothetical protein [Alphaproteobacteria bacterium]